jgi:hypothetical protein
MSIATFADLPADSGCFLRDGDGRCGVPFGTCPYQDERLALYYRPGGTCRPPMAEAGR